MPLGSPEVIRTDVLVIGGGGAGLRASIEAHEQSAEVLLVSHSRAGYGNNTSISGGGFAAVLSSSKDSAGPEDRCEWHLEDTITGGYFLSNQELVELMVRGAEPQVRQLRRFGVSFSTPQELPWVKLSVDPGHRRSRMVYGQHAFGTDFTFPLRRYALSCGVKFLEGVLITRLLLQEEQVVGAMGVDTRGQVLVLLAAAVVLASGGLGQLYLRNDNAAGTIGDGYALAYEAGATLMDMEFVQFYPLSLGSGNPAVFYECLLGAGGKLVNKFGEDILARHDLVHPRQLTRDRLSRAMAKEVAEGRGFGPSLLLDLGDISAEKLRVLQPILPKAVRGGRRRCWVAPTAHFQMGGVRINERAETSISGLYAAGEVCAGLHGANRLSGNALTELWVFGSLAGREAARRARETGRVRAAPGLISDEVRRLQKIASSPGEERPELLHRQLKELMWDKVGLIREAPGLQQALEELISLEGRWRRSSVRDGRELQRVLKLGRGLRVSQMICRAALYRTESRGAHYRGDYPEQDDDKWLCNVLLSQKDGDMVLSTEPVKFTRLAPAR